MTSHILIEWDQPLHYDCLDGLVLYRKKYPKIKWQQIEEQWNQADNYFNNVFFNEIHGCKDNLSGNIIYTTDNIFQDSYLDIVDDYGLFGYAVYSKHKSGALTLCAFSKYLIKKFNNLDVVIELLD